MSDFSSDVGNTTLNASIKTIELMAKFLKWIEESGQRHLERSAKKVDREYKEEQIKYMKRTGQASDDMKRMVSDHRGLMKLQAMQKEATENGDVLITSATSMSQKEIDRLTQYGKAMGFAFATVEDSKIVATVKDITERKAEFEKVYKESVEAVEKIDADLAKLDKDYQSRLDDVADWEKAIKATERDYKSGIIESRDIYEKQMADAKAGLEKAKARVMSPEDYKGARDFLVAQREEAQSKVISKAEYESKMKGFDDKLNELNAERGKKLLVFRQQDAPKISQAIEQMNWENNLSDKEAELLLYEQKGEANLSQEEKANRDKAKREVAELKKDEFDKYNIGSNTSAIHKMSREEAVATSAVAFGLACDRKEINAPCYIVNRLDPSKFAEATTRETTNNAGVPYRETEFLLKAKENGAETQVSSFVRSATTKGEQTSEAGEKFWSKAKEDLSKHLVKENAPVLIFSQKEDMEKYQKQMQDVLAKSKMLDRAEYTNRSDEVKVWASPEAYKNDLDGIINSLKGQLADHNMALNAQNEVVSAKTGEAIVGDKLPDNERFAFESAKISAEQIKQLESLKALASQRVRLENQVALGQIDEQTGKESIAQIERDMLSAVDKYNSLESDRLLSESSRIGDDITLANNREVFESEERTESVEVTRGEDKVRATEKTDMSKAGWEKATESIKNVTTKASEAIESVQQI